MQTEGEMMQDNDSILWKDSLGHWSSRLVPLMILLVCLGTLLAIPLKIVGYGFVPFDDALRHAGFVVTDKTWNEVLVSDASIPDVHVGWHSTLRGAHDLLGMDADSLVVFSVVLLFLICILPPLFMNRRPESWIIALLIAYSFAGPGERLLFGRPYIGYVAVMMWLLFRRERLNAEKTPWLGLSVLTMTMAISIWWRTTWFLYALPMAAFFLARQWRAFFRVGIMVVVATGVATLLSGNLLLAWDSLALAMRVMGSADHTSQLVGELQPLTKYAVEILAVVALALVVGLRGGNLRRMFDSPVFYLIILGWCLGCSSRRWWIDFGVPAFVVLFSEEIDRLLSGESTTWFPFPWFSASRGMLVLFACGTLYLSYVSDANGRWSNSLRNEYVDIGDESLAEGLPGQGGIIYGDDMGIFYQTFFKHPEAEWKYLLGYEPAFMPEDDLETYRAIQWNRAAWESFSPWVEKMRPQDRLWVTQSLGAPVPAISELEWIHLTTYIWSGRLKQEETSGGDD